MDATNRRLRGFAKSLILVMATTAGSLLANALPASAQPLPLPPFTQCPPVGMDTSCSVLIVYQADGSRVTLVDPSQLPYDGVEDTLIGVQNNSTIPVSSLTLSGPFIFGFDGDGLCAPFTTPKPAGCPYGPTGYEGRGSSNSIASTAPGGGNSFTIIDFNNGKVIFSPNIPPGGSAYFSLEGPASSVAPPLPPSMLTLNPLAAVNTVGTTHTVTATVTNSLGNPVQGIVVVFSVAGSVTANGSCTTNTSGQCSFMYTGPALPGGDKIHAFADTNKNGMEDVMPFEPSGNATKVWALPPSTALCEVDVTYGGWIHAMNRDRANFGGNAKVDKDNNPEGQEEYQDQGPVTLMNVHSINVLSVVCPSTTTASIFGEATINGSGTYVYRIDVEDNNEPGKGFDKYQIRLSTGYDSGRQTLEGGNIQIHK